MQYLNRKFPNRWSGRGGAQKWPPRSPDLKPIRLPRVGLNESYGVCTHGEHERRTTPANSQHCKKYQQRCSVRQVTSFLVTHVGKCIQADGGHLEQVA
jgi:hypothetical protein